MSTAVNKHVVSILKKPACVEQTDCKVPHLWRQSAGRASRSKLFATGWRRVRRLDAGADGVGRCRGLTDESAWAGQAGKAAAGQAGVALVHADAGGVQDVGV